MTTVLAPPSRTHARLAALALAPLMAISAWLGTSAPAHAASFDAAAAEQQMVNLINQDRAQNGLPALTANPTLGNIARGGDISMCGQTVHGRSVDMIERGYFSHQVPPCGGYVWPAIQSAGLNYSSAGENIAWNNTSPQASSVDQANTALMNSTGHRANILGSYNQVGVGVWMAPGPWSDGTRTYNGVVMYTEVFVQAPIQQPPPPNTTSPVGGVVMDRFGGLHSYGNQPVSTSGFSYWPGWNIARGVVLKADRSGGYTLDGWGGVHAFGSAAPTSPSAYWPGWDIARGIALCNGGGYTLDGYGGIHPFGTAPTQAASAYWSGWDIARDIVVSADCSAGYTMDGFGGLHRFGSAPNIADSAHAYWPGWTIARGLALRADGHSGYTLDGYGGVHEFGGAPGLPATGYWTGWDIARGITLNAGDAGGYTLDGWGGIHPFGAGGNTPTTASWPGWDIAGGLAGS
jgi:uncharacterized protein YkwD